MVTAEERPVARDALDERFDAFATTLDKRFDAFATTLDKHFDAFTRMIDRQFNRMMWAFGLGGIGIFAILGYIISRLP